MIGKRELILGIESSCDDTAVAVVDRNGKVLGAEVATQELIHSAHGGVYPEFASRAHARSIIPAISRVLEVSKVTSEDIRAIGVTRGPGLIGPLMVGLHAASGLGLGWGVQVIGINHLRGHLRSADLEHRRINYPAVILLVSGGHTFLAHMESPIRVRMLGTTRDDSVGEAYDKVARMLGLGYPGGPAIDRLAATGTANISFPRPMLGEGLDFSFSGLKSSVARYLERNRNPVVANVAASFVRACLDVLIAKSRIALMTNKKSALIIVGGVAASPQLRTEAKFLTDEIGVDLCLPPLKWATDNGAMIALAAWDYVELGHHPLPIAQTRIPLSVM
jgi:N6-L-threonylcarbamoyladenine synthase